MQEYPPYLMLGTLFFRKLSVFVYTFWWRRVRVAGGEEYAESSCTDNIGC